MDRPYLQFDQISKQFPGVRALDAVTFGAGAGRVHALLGENGAGKSTLLKILSGVHRPDAGAILIGGRRHDFRSESDAIRAGIAVIYQELQLIPEMSVAENLYLGHLPNRFGWIDRQRLFREATCQLDMLGERIDPHQRISTLPIAQRQMVEIAKALTRNARIIAFDEPTSSLSTREVDRLFAVIHHLRSQGRIILYVSHRMEEVFDLCDGATVLRDGRHVETFDSLSGVTQETLIRCMVGRSIDDLFRYQPRPHGNAVLEVDRLTGPGLTQAASLSIAQGEIVGLFGLVGAGRTELLRLIYGATPPTGGRVKVLGKTVRLSTPASAIRNGIVLCPEDRKREGIIPMGSVMDNLNLSGRRHFSPLGFVIHERRERENAATHVDRLSIRTPSLNQLIQNLSGGNQQKVILARWLSEDIKVLLLDEPTRGIDIGAKSEIHAIIHDLACRGAGVLMVSSELPEVLGVCDRILVMRQGLIAASIPREQATPDRILEHALPSGAN